MMFIGQYTIEQKQDGCLIDDHLSNGSISSPLCAWCLSEQGVAAGEGSHGICKKHADSFLVQWRENRSHRIMARV
jgi:hypothetical protein